MSGVHSLLMGMGSRPMPEFIDAGTAAYEAPISGTLDIPYPATIAAGNILIMHIWVQDSGGGAITDPAGWTLVGTNTFAGASGISKVFWKLATGGESGFVQITASADIRSVGRMYRFTRGTGVEAHGVTTEATSDTSVPVVDITTLGLRRLAIQCIWVQALAGDTIGNITGETGTDYTEAVAEFVDSGALLSLQTGQVQNPTAITGGSATLNNARTNKAIHGFAITP